MQQTPTFHTDIDNRFRYAVEI